MVAPLAEADLRARWVLHEAPLFELPHVVHVVHGGQRDWLFGPMLAAGPDSPLISIAAPVHPSATASPMARVYGLCLTGNVASDGLSYGAMRCASHLKVSPGNALQPTECVSSWQLPEGS